MPLTLQVLMTPGCEHGPMAVALARQVLEALAPGVRPETIVVGDPVDADRLRFPGSPTVRVNGVDVDPAGAGGTGFG